MYLTQEQLKTIGFKSVGNNVLISDKASIYGAERIEIGCNVRIDDFCILSAGEGGIEIGKYVHIACYTSLLGKGKITLKDFVGVSGRVSIYSSTDDFSGRFLHGVTVPKEFTNVTSSDVIMKEFTVVGVGSVILPGAIIDSNSAIGALSVVKGYIPANEIHAGIPAKKIGVRDLTIYELAKKLLQK